jgi:alginate O-acetyltransferase complex protein AlgI
MLFSSLTFLFVFLPITLLLYYLSPKKWKNGLLLSLSILFFAWGGVSYTLLFIGSIFLNFFFAKQINRTIKSRRKWLTVGIVTNLTLLVLFKYISFFIGNINLLFFYSGGTDTLLPELKIALPLGISFYTFHQMSMLWDIYRRVEKIELKLSECALYVSFFPQLIAGPIVRYKDIIHQIQGRTESLTLFTQGAERFIIGLAKKVIIANAMASLADEIFSFNPEEVSAAVVWLGTIAYALQIYFDFSGYSDMAIGLAKMFGFHLLENFNLPYTARSIQDFWRRWHISLSTWFRDYVYIPIGGNRLGIKRTYINLFLVFILTGFWHGATWSFVFWGVFHGFFLIFERIGLSKILEKFSLIGWIYTLFVVMIGWIFFRIENFSTAVDFIQQLFASNHKEQLGLNYFLNAENLLLLIFGVALAAPIWLTWNALRFEKFKLLTERATIVRQTLLLGLLLYAVMLINANSYNPFIYFKF